jgi:hypothetical protein
VKKRFKLFSQWQIGGRRRRIFLAMFVIFNIPKHSIRNQNSATERAEKIDQSEEKITKIFS